MKITTVASINLYDENPYILLYPTCKYWSKLIDGPTNLFGIYWNIDVLQVCEPNVPWLCAPPPPQFNNNISCIHNFSYQVLVT